MKHTLSWKRTFYLFGGLAVLIVVAGFIVFSKEEPTQTPYDSAISLFDNVEKCFIKHTGREQADCYDEVMAEYLRTEEPAAALAAFNAAMKGRPEVRRDCHQIAHAIGRATLVKVGSIVAVFNFDRNVDSCAGGFFHGAIEKLFRPTDGTLGDVHIDLDEFDAKVPMLCDSFEIPDRKSECVHGVGHGAMFLMSGLDRALKSCGLFPKGSDHFSCYSGIFMERTLGERGKTARSRDPHVPCRDLKDPYRNACYYVQSFRMLDLGITGKDLIEECRKAPSPAGAFCVRGYGIFHLAHDALADGFGPVVQFCESLGRTDARVCGEAVTSRLAAHSQNGKYAMPFCAMFNSSYLRERCFAYAADVLRLGHKVEPDAIRKDCHMYLNDDLAQECAKVTL